MISRELKMDSFIKQIMRLDVETKGMGFVALDLGEISLEKTDRLMAQLANLRTQDLIPDVVLILAHSPTLAVGARNLNPQDLLQPVDFFDSRGIGLVKTVRGGGLTYHWPGQLVCYPVMKLQPHEQNLSAYMYKLEEVGLRTLREFGIDANRKRDKTAQIGLWLGNNKIASTGIHVSRWVTSYGFALNIGGDKAPADYIRPCGLEGVKLITVSDVLGFEVLGEIVKSKLIGHFERVFERKANFLETEEELFLVNSEQSERDFFLREKSHV